MWISVCVTEIPRAIITPRKCCSARFRPDNKNWCFCASFNHPLLFTLFLEKPLITTPVTVGACWQQRNAKLVVLFCFINLCPWSLLHPYPVRLVKLCRFYEFLVGVVNTELNNFFLNYVFNTILGKVCWVSDRCMGRKAWERNLSSKGRSDCTWSTFCSCHLCSFGGMGKDRLAHTCPLSCAALQAALQGGESQSESLHHSTQLVPWHQHLWAAKSQCLMSPKLETRVWAPQCISAAKSTLLISLSSELSYVSSCSLEQFEFNLASD